MKLVRSWQMSTRAGAALTRHVSSVSEVYTLDTGKSIVLIDGDNLSLWTSVQILVGDNMFVHITVRNEFEVSIVFLLIKLPRLKSLKILICRTQRKGKGKGNIML